MDNLNYNDYKIEHKIKNDGKGICGVECVFECKVKKSNQAKRKRVSFKNEPVDDPMNGVDINENNEPFTDNNIPDNVIPIQKVEKGTRGFIDDFSNKMAPGW